MLGRKQQATHTRQNFNLFARIILFIAILLATITTGVFAITGATSTVLTLSGVFTVVLAIITAIQLYPILFPEQPKVSSAVLTSLNIMLRGNVTQSVGVETEHPVFFFNLPLRDHNEFYGHKAARVALITRTANGGSSSIVGERRAGKTWLLDYLRLVASTHSKLGPAYRIGSVSAAHPRSKSLTNFVQWVLEELQCPLASHDSGLQPLDHLSQGVRDIKKQGVIPVLCIDEFEGFDTKQEFSNDFIDGLRALTQNEGLILVTASKRPLKELIKDLTGPTSPLFNVVQHIPLSPFTEQEARQFVHTKSDKAGFTMKERDFFFSQSMLYNNDGDSYWFPLRLQLVGQMLLDEKQDTGQSLDDKLDDVDYLRDFERRLNETYQAVVR